LYLFQEHELKDWLLLFDIDLTLTKSDGSGIRALERHFRSYTGHNGEIRHPRPDGRCDTWIVEQLFIMNGLVYDSTMYEDFMQGYLKELTEIYRPPTACVMQGVPELLKTLQQREDMYLGLVTGNDYRGARIKLGAFNLYHYFPAGGFGSDSSVRADLVPLAIERANRHYAKNFTLRQSVIIGDSENDVRAANIAGAHCIAVASGYTSREELSAAGRCVVIDDLCNIEEIIRIVENFEE